MIKPIVYHSFEEKEILTKKLMADIPIGRRLSISRALMKIFYRAGKKKQGLINHSADGQSSPGK